MPLPSISLANGRAPQGVLDELIHGSAGVDETVQWAGRQKVLVDNLPFHLPTARDAWTVAMLAGVRDNDFHGAAATALPEHVEVDLAPASRYLQVAPGCSVGNDWCGV